jgi:uncharacterized protein YecE (DUF72 family)
MWLEYYAEQFDTVELNASFYRIPKSTVAEGWCLRTPGNFRFSVKVSRLITHVRRLVDCENELNWFFSALKPLHTKTAAFLLQFPPSFSPDVRLLSEFMSMLPQGNRYVFEFRNPDAYGGLIPEMLAEGGASFCIHDLAGCETPSLVTSDLVYIRFHGSTGRYAGDYPDEALAEWAQKIRVWERQGKQVFAYFNNDLGGNAVKNAATLLQLTGSYL